MAITRRDALRLGAAGLLPFLLPRRLFAGDPPAGGGAGRPNVIVMMVDDMGFSDLGCFGSEIQTPNLDALAAGGLRLTNFHNTARCWPSRGCIMTGLYPQQAGEDDIEAPAAERSRRKVQNLMIPEILRPAGYATAAAGKWHLPASMKDRFGRCDFQSGNGCCSYFDEKYGPTRYITDHVGDTVTRYVDEFGRAKQPFFLYWTPTAPHYPLQALTADIALYKGKYDAGPKALAEARHKRQVELGITDAAMPWTPPPETEVDVPPSKHEKRLPRDYRTDVCTEVDLAAPPPPKDFPWCGWKSRGLGNRRKATSFEEMMEIYAAMVHRMDANVGKVVAKLKEVGAFENTLVLFCSDNGASSEGMSYGPAWAAASNTPFLRWKKDAYEGGVASSCILHWPARQAAATRGQINRSFGHLIDVLPTVCEAAGATHPGKDLQGNAVPAPEGRSLLGVFDGNRTVPLTKPIFVCHAGNRAVITEGWKLVSQGGEPWRLHDLAKDRNERQDVAAAHPAEVARLEGHWKDFCARTQAPLSGQVPKTKGKGEE